MKHSPITFNFAFFYALMCLCMFAAPQMTQVGVAAKISAASASDIPPASRYEAILLLASLAFVPLLMVEAHRATCALVAISDGNAAPFYYPHWLMLPYLAFVISPFLLPATTKAISPFAGASLYPLWPVAGLSVVAFNTAAAQIDAHNQGRQVRVQLLDALYLSGGFLGVVAARRLFRGSPVLDEFPEGFPSWMLYLMAILYGSRFFPGPF